jgi:hypothetical protein
MDAVPPLHRHRHHRHLRLDRHEKRPALERQQGARLAAGAFGKCQERVAGAQRLRHLLDGGHRLIPAGTLDRHESPHLEGPAQERESLELRLEENVKAPVERVEETGGSTLLW